MCEAARRLLAPGRRSFRAFVSGIAETGDNR